MEVIMLRQRLFALIVNSNRCYLHYVKITGFLQFVIVIANRGNYLHLSIVIHKAICNNNALSVNYSHNLNY